MNKLYKILKTIKILNEEDLSFFSDIDLEFSKQQDDYLFVISTDSLIPYEIYNKVSAFSYEGLKFRVEVILKRELVKEEITQVLKNIVNKNADILFFDMNISKNLTELKGELLIFKYIVDSEKEEIELLFDDIKKLFKTYVGKDIKSFHFEIDEEIKNHVDNLRKIEEKNKEQAILHQQQKIAKKNEEKIFDNSKFKGKKLLLDEIFMDQNSVIIEGEIYSKDFVERTKFSSYKIYLNDYNSTILTKALFFPQSNYKSKDDILKKTIDELEKGDWVKIQADIKTDQYETETYALIKNITKISKPDEYISLDTSANKRNELCVHTKMSAFDGIIDIEELFKTLSSWGHTAVGIADRYNVQIFPEIQKLANKYNIKPIYGSEFEIMKEFPPLILNSNNTKIDDNTYIVFDLETTGLTPEFDDIIEFGAIKYKDNEIIEKIDFFIKPKKSLSAFTTQLTSIRNSDVENAVSQEQGMVKILEWIGNYPLIAHNAIDFDFNFLIKKCEQFNLPMIHNPVIDTLPISRALFPDYKSHTLGKMCAKLGITYNTIDAHRADYDAEVLFYLWIELVKKMKEFDVIFLDDINTKLTSKTMKSRYKSNFIYVYAKKQESLKVLYKLISTAHTDNYCTRPMITYPILDAQRKDLIICNSPIDGNLWNLALNSTTEKLKQAINFYDYIFVSPPSCYFHEISDDRLSLSQVKETILKIINIAISLNKKVIATSNSYYLNKWDKKYQEVYLYAKGLGGKRHRYYWNKKLPDTYLRNTNQMFDEFSFIKDQQLLENIIVNNTKEFIDEIENEIKPIKDKLYTPHIDNVEKMITDKVYEKTHAIYGDKIPEIIELRLKKELDSIIGHGYGVVYWVSHLLVKKSLSDGYVVGSRGSVGSSLVATMLEITDVNPLQAHYYCRKCKYCEFNNDVEDGYDLEEKKCPNCDEILIGDGHNIPFETFLGFKGEKVPDIDLNFSGEYQVHAHNFIKELFGADHAFRAGTISTIADKTAFGHIKAYFEETNQNDKKNSEVMLYVSKCKETKKTTGQHPGGILVVPKDLSMCDFSPYNFPADDTTSSWYTTHFAFEYIHDNLLKFDILGHDNPTILRQLKQLTNIDMYDIPNNDKEVIKLFSSTEPLKIIDENCLKDKTGAISLPEFGTKFVREMLNHTKPSSFDDLIRISGLSHGTDVYVGNAKSLIKEKGLKLKDVIACRDDIMNYLISKKIDHSISFNIMEDVRKGKGLKEEYKDIMLRHDIPEWYIESCNKIKYIFPKAHATAYVQHAYKFAWYKIYYPLPYYATYFSNKTDAIDIDIICQGRDVILEKVDEINKMLFDKTQAAQVKKKELDLLVNFTVALEMLSRGFKFYKPDILKSDPKHFIILEDGLLIPLNSINGLGETAALSVEEARKNGPFSSIDDLNKRTKLNNTNIQYLKDIGVLDDLPDNNQISLF